MMVRVLARFLAAETALLSRHPDYVRQVSAGCRKRACRGPGTNPSQKSFARRYQEDNPALDPGVKSVGPPSPLDPP